MTFKQGDWVTVKPAHDIPVMFRPGGKPTRGRVHEVTGDVVEIWVPIDGEDVDEHSQACVYAPDQLTAEST